jgi:excisionase family DNA binding protein
MTQKASDTSKATYSSTEYLDKYNVASIASKASASSPKEYLDKYELAQVLGLSTRTVEKWTRERKLPHFKVGYHTVRYRLADIARAMRKNHFVEEVSA